MGEFRTMTPDLVEIKRQEEKVRKEGQLSRFLEKMSIRLAELGASIVGKAGFKIISVSDLVEETPSLFKGSASVELYDKIGFKKLDIPFQINMEKEEISLPDKDILTQKISSIVVDTSVSDKIAENTLNKLREIDENIKIRKETYEKSLVKEEKLGIKEGGIEKKEAFNEPSKVIRLIKINYPASFKVGDLIPIDKLSYKITGEDSSEWTLQLVEYTSK